MTIFSKIIELLVGTAWPIALVVGLMLFKKPLTNLLHKGRIKLGREGIELSGPDPASQTAAVANPSAGALEAPLAATPKAGAPVASGAAVPPIFVALYEAVRAEIVKALPEYERRAGVPRGNRPPKRCCGLGISTRTGALYQIHLWQPALTGRGGVLSLQDAPINSTTRRLPCIQLCTAATRSSSGSNISKRAAWSPSQTNR